MKGALDGLRTLSGGRLPKWSPALARPVNFVAPQRAAATHGSERIVYFPSCAARTMGRSVATARAAPRRRCR